LTGILFWKIKMNFTNNTFDNQTIPDDNYYYIYSSLEFAFSLYFNTFSEYFWLVVYFPVAFIGTLLNLVNFIVFSKKEFNIKLYTYFRHVSFFSMICCLVSSIYPFSVAKIFETSNYEFTAWQCYFYIPVGITFYYYVSVLDIIILIDRLSTFVPKLKSIYSKVQANKICIICLIITITIQFPYFFVFQPVIFNWHYFGQNRTIQIYSVSYTVPTNFAISLEGQIVTYVIYALREGTVIFIIIALNIANMIFLKRHLRKRAKMLKRGNTEQQQDGKEDGKDDKKDAKKKKEGNVDRKASIMVAIMCTVTSITNTLFMSSIINFYFNVGAGANIFGQFGEFSIILKYFTNFFVFYFFNTNFKSEFKKMVKLKA
jgi:hypothetical protein